MTKLTRKASNKSNKNNIVQIVELIIKSTQIHKRKALFGTMEPTFMMTIKLFKACFACVTHKQKSEQMIVFGVNN